MLQVFGHCMDVSRKLIDLIFIISADKHRSEGNGGSALTYNQTDNTPGGGTNMSVANCVYSCQQDGYLLAGVEDASQCCKFLGIDDMLINLTVTRLW